MDILDSVLRAFIIFFLSCGEVILVGSGIWFFKSWKENSSKGVPGWENRDALFLAFFVVGVTVNKPLEGELDLEFVLRDCESFFFLLGVERIIVRVFCHVRISFRGVIWVYSQRILQYVKLRVVQFRRRETSVLYLKKSAGSAGIVQNLQTTRFRVLSGRRAEVHWNILRRFYSVLHRGLAVFG